MVEVKMVATNKAKQNQSAKATMKVSERKVAFQKDLDRDHTKMPAIGKEEGFPRTDNYFRTKESLAFQETHTRPWQIREAGAWEAVQEFAAFPLLGFGIGLIGFFMDLLEQLLVYVKDATTQSTINKAVLNNGSHVSGWLFYAFYGTGLVFISCLMTTYWGKGAMGSGVAEVIGYINGVNYPEAIDIKTVITKIFGVVLAVAGGIAVGKEGPLAHIGANVGAALVYLPGLTFLQNDRMKRGLICAGASAGVSVAFGAPIGGALFMYELSRENPAWDFKLLWKTFITCAVAVFTTGLFDNALHG